MSTSKKLLVAAIDFGTTYSGYAFSFKHEYDVDPTKVTSNNWTAGSRGLISFKTPTTVLLDQNKKFHSFGYAAEDKYSDLAEEEEHHGWYYFRRFKMMLFQKKGLKKDIMLKDINDRELPAMLIFSEAIRFLKSHLMDTLDKRATGIQLDDVHWVLTVPAIWDDAAKQFMRVAAEKAGIDTDNLSIALEPEAASLYCKHLPVEKISGCDSQNFSAFSPGSRYLVLDAGGGTVDITVHEVNSNGTLKELQKASGGAWGGSQVDESFRQFLIKIVGANILVAFKDQCTSDYVDMLREFETKKRSVKADTGGKVTIKIPISLKELFEEQTEEDIKECINCTPFAGKVQWVGDKVRIHSDIFKKLFENAAENIVQHVRKLFKEQDLEGTNTILMVGGFSESALLQDRIRKAFPSPAYRVIIPSEAGLAVLKGAVLFGHNPTTIASRIAKYTYGVSTTREFDPATDPSDKKKRYGNMYRCVDVFSRHVQKGQTLVVDEAQTERKYTPVYKDQTAMSFEVFISDDSNPRFVTDHCCQRLGKINVDIPDLTGGLDREVWVKMIFGGTEIKVEAREQRTGKITTARFDFLD